MNFYNRPHQFYCGIDLHARLLAICILDHAGNIVCQTKIEADKQILLDTLAPYRADVVVSVECLFASPPNDKDKLPGRLQDLHAARNQDGGPGQLHPFVMPRSRRVFAAVPRRMKHDVVWP